MKLKILQLFVCLCLLISPFIVNGQEEDGGLPNPGDDPDQSVPIDGGLSLLIAAGVGYGAKKAYDANKKAKSTSEEK